MEFIASLPQDQVFWYAPEKISPALTHDITTDVVVIGGGMAGLSAAQSFAQKGCRVVLLEKNYCGSGASGKSSGFITPDSELPLSYLVQSFGSTTARNIWNFIQGGVEYIQHNIQTHHLDCDYQEQDTLVVANTPKGFINGVEKEYQAQHTLGFSSTLYQREQLPTIINTDKYHGGVSYPGTFAIRAYQYCAGMKEVLARQGVQIYEQTPVTDIQDGVVTTQAARIKAAHIVVCTDHAAAQLASMADKVYHVQTFLLASAPLTAAQVQHIFPERPYMVWDTALIYHYYRLTGDNRLLLGGARLRDTYARHENHHNTAVASQLAHHFRTIFPQAAPHFEYMWPGLIGISKDLLPLAGPDIKMPSVYYITAVAGLPWAAALGRYSADHIIDSKNDFDEILNPYRSHIMGPRLQRVLGKPLTFALSNFLTVGSL